MSRDQQSALGRPDVVDVIRRRPVAIAIVTATAIVFSLIASATIPPVYEARAVFYLLTNVVTPTDPGIAAAKSS